MELERGPFIGRQSAERLSGFVCGLAVSEAAKEGDFDRLSLLRCTLLNDSNYEVGVLVGGTARCSHVGSACAASENPRVSALLPAAIECFR